DHHQILTDSPGPGKYRGGVGLNKASTLNQAANTVISYVCDRERAVVWGIEGGLPSMPHGFWLKREGESEAVWLGSIFSDVEIHPGDQFSRPTAGGGGLGDPLERDPEAVCEDVADDYVSVARAARDYGVVIREIDAELAEYEVDREATKAARAELAIERQGWIKEDPKAVAERYRKGEIDNMDMVRRYAVIVDWGTGELMPKSTEQFRESVKMRSADHWNDNIAELGKAAE
ncbi:MAG: hydantoinase B/oxoprolinase family protein, partial [Alphaproteobacteria bacterium]|nr:hydantoinase B/oxoprolinase family protein [Alphaproteobacteria bacterium]